VLALLLLFRRLVRLIRRGVLTTDIGETFPLADVRAACAAAERPGRRGKVLLRLDQ
jgi:NADPH:quinone reductase-like Zn-dependent oxidoreductase